MIKIEPLSSGSAPMLAGMHAECFGAECWSVDQMRGSLMLESTQGWLAQAENEPAGFLLCQMAGGEAEILTFCVRPSRQRRGVGERLLRRMLENLPPDSAAHLEVAADNIPARRLYEKCGFVHVNTRTGYYRRESGLVDAICYRYEAGKKPENLQA